jgi:hypothetical protein
MKSVTVEALKTVSEIKKVSPDYPTIWADFPTAIYRTMDKPHEVDSKGNELQTYWTITIEIYSVASLTSITTQVLEVFSGIGFIGTKKDANTASLKRVIIELSGIVDNVTKFVYTK